jgi:hypothetical protein
VTATRTLKRALYTATPTLKSALYVAGLFLIAGCGRTEPAAVSRPDLQGMWSDPPSSAEAVFCFVGCTEEGIAHLNALLDDPANDDRPFDELNIEAFRWQDEQYMRPRLTDAALKTYPLDPADDPGFLHCQPWGFARQILAPHQMAIRQFDDRVEIRYGEWDGRRTIYLDGRKRPANDPPSRMGYSTGRYEGNALVIETSGVAADITFWFQHSDQLRAVERYTRSADGNRLEAVITIEDPWGLRQPVHVKKTWGWAPTEQIFPYVDCELPNEVRKGTTPLP